MDIFVPDGYLTLPATIDRVAAIIHGEKLVALSAQEEQKLEREKQRLDDFRRPEPHEWTGPRHRDAAVKIPELSYAEFQELKSKSAEVAEQRDAARGVIRQYLYAGRLHSQVLHYQGHRYDIPKHVWGGLDGSNALRSGKISLGMGTISGQIIIPQDALEVAFSTKGAVKEEPEPVAPESPEEKPAKKSETHHRGEDICKLFKDISATKPQAARGQIYSLMRIAQPGLFTNRREGVRGKGITDLTIDRIIREQRKR